MEQFEQQFTELTTFASQQGSRKRRNSLFDSTAFLPKLNFEGVFDKFDLEFSNEKNNKLEEHMDIYEHYAPSVCTYSPEISFIEDVSGASHTSRLDMEEEEDDYLLSSINKKIKKSKVGQGKLHFSKNLIKKFESLKQKTKRIPQSRPKNTWLPAPKVKQEEKKTRKLTRNKTAKAVISSSTGSKTLDDDESLKLKLTIDFSIKKGTTFADLKELPFRAKQQEFLPGLYSSFPINFFDLLEDEQEKKERYYEFEDTSKKRRNRRRKNQKVGHMSHPHSDISTFKKVYFAIKKSKLLNIRSNIITSRLIDNLSEMEFVSVGKAESE